MKKCTLEDVCEKKVSNILQKDVDEHKGQYPIFGASGLIGHVDFYEQERPYIAVVKDGAGVGRIFLLPPYSSVIGTMQYILPRNVVYIHYLYYAMQYMNLGKYYKGAAIPHIYFKDYKEEPLKLPAIEIQKKLADNLDSVNRMLFACKKQLAKLDTLVKSRFIEMFGDPVTNPYGYPIYSLSDISSSRLGKMLDRKKQTGENSHPYLANYNVQWFRFELGNLNKMDFDEADRQEFELKKGDLLVCEGGEVGRCAIWNNEMEGCYFQKALHRVRCNPEYIIPEYLGYTFFWHSQYNGFSDAISGVSTIAHLPGDRLKKLQIIVPPLDLQHRFAEFIHLADKSKSVLQKLLEKQELLRAALMQEYFG